MSDSFQLSLFDDEQEQAKSLDYIAIDFETANQYRSSAISIGLVRYIKGKENDNIYERIYPPIIEKTPGLPLVAHNAKFDMSVIWDACNYYHHKLPGYNYFCSLQLSKKGCCTVEELLKKCGLKLEKI